MYLFNSMYLMFYTSNVFQLYVLWFVKDHDSYFTKKEAVYPR